MRGDFQSPRGGRKNARSLKRASLVKPFILPTTPPLEVSTSEADTSLTASQGEVVSSKGQKRVSVAVTENESFEGMLDVDEFGVFLQF